VQQAKSIARPAPRRPLRLPHARLLLRATTVVVVAVTLWLFVVAPLTGHFSGQFEDFRAYLAAARDMAAGHSPYRSFDGQFSVVMTGFDYPPFGAVLVRPLALLSDQAAMTVWIVLSVACTVAGAFVVARTALPESWPRTEIALLGALAFCPATYNYWHGQMNPVIFLLLALAFRSWVRGREVSCGVLLGLAAGIKLAIGPSTIRTFVTGVLPSLTRETGWLYNQSLSGALSRAADHSVLDIQATLPWLHDLSLLGSVALLGVAAWAVRPGGRDAAERGAEFGVAVTAMLLAGTIAWYPHFTHLLIPLAAAAGLLAARGRRVEGRLLQATLAVLLLFGVLLPIALSNLTAISQLRSAQDGAGWWPLLQAFSLPALSVLALFGTLVHALRRRQPLPVAGAAA
jgi:hypothetical protein